MYIHIHIHTHFYILCVHTYISTQTEIHREEAYTYTHVYIGQYIVSVTVSHTQYTAPEGIDAHARWINPVQRLRDYSFISEIFRISLKKMAHDPQEMDVEKLAGMLECLCRTRVCGWATHGAFTSMMISDQPFPIFLPLPRHDRRVLRRRDRLHLSRGRSNGHARKPGYNTRLLHPFPTGMRELVTFCLSHPLSRGITNIPNHIHLGGSARQTTNHSRDDAVL